MTFKTEQTAFSGPLGLLLDVLNKNELEITEVALAKIADEFLTYVEDHEVPSEELADFLLIATRLIYLKSRELMPYLRTEEEEGCDGVSLEDQLRLYRMFVESADELDERFLSDVYLFRRPFKRINFVKNDIFMPAKNVTRNNLHQAFQSLVKRLEPFFALQETAIERIKSVEERMLELQAAVASRSVFTFQDIARPGKSRPEVVVSFLALLELIRRQVVTAKQAHDKNDIIINKV